MKKITILSFCLAMVVTLSACGENGISGRLGGSSKGTSDVLNARIAEESGLGSSEKKTVKTPDNYNSDSSSGGNDANGSTSGSESGIGSSSSSNSNASSDTTSSQAMEESVPDTSHDGIDIDLTMLSATMVYTEVYSIMSDPDSYKGKVVRMKGAYSAFYDSSTDKYYFACIIKDATACCAQGIEFVLTDDYTFPDDYPEDGDTITVTGTFSTYVEGQNLYCTLKDAKLE